uniref:protein FAM162B-like isoform X1 n=1 Tax=Myxine glutinosa TaxID=7769 RepID=UPI00358E2275
MLNGPTHLFTQALSDPSNLLLDGPCSDKPLLPYRRPTLLDKRILLWARRHKTFDDIPEVVSFQMINTAKNRLRVKIAYIMIIFTIVGCFIMITSGKKAFARQESLAQLSRKKIDRWREEAKIERQSHAK